jgi:predicted  nucleic acid-binding Zn-ribbon protein
MIQSIMLVALGFLIATLGALLLAPSFWRRAERLTTRRLERTMPMSIADTEADRDQLRASYAIVIRRLEAALSREKMRCARRLVKISKLEMEIASLNDRVAQLRSQLDAEHNAASVLRRTIATRVPELNRAAHEARQLLHVREREISGIVNRLRHREEALATAQRTTEMQQAEIARLRQSMEMSGAQNAGRFKLRPTQWTIHDYRAEYDRLNVELSKLRERLAVAYDREANQVTQLRTELQQLADQIVTAASALPESEGPRAIAGSTSEDTTATAGEKSEIDQAERSIDAIIAGNGAAAPPSLPSVAGQHLQTGEGPDTATGGGGVSRTLFSPVRMARDAFASISDMAGAARGGRPSASGENARAGHASAVSRTSGRLSATKLLGGAAAPEAGRKDRPVSRSEPDRAVGETTASTQETRATANPSSGADTPHVATGPAQRTASRDDRAGDPDDEGGNLYDYFRSARAKTEKDAAVAPSEPVQETSDDKAPSGPETRDGPAASTHADEPSEPADAAASEASARKAEGASGNGPDAPASAPRSPGDTGPGNAGARSATDEVEAQGAPEAADDEDSRAGTADEEGADSTSSSLLDRLKQVPGSQSH